MDYPFPPFGDASAEFYPRPRSYVAPAFALPAQVRFDFGRSRLYIIQQPEEALAVTKGKERVRKPIDPPLVVQVKCPREDDPHGVLFSNPSLFGIVVLIDRDGNAVKNGVSGTTVSSGYKLKDTNNKDGVFLVFGDISANVAGTYKLRCNLFEVANGEARFLASTDSQEFKVVTQKDFKGLAESTYLSRAFSDQGVRLRLRKEARGMMGKRTRSYKAEDSDDQAYDNKKPKSGEGFGAQPGEGTYTQTLNPTQLATRAQPVTGTRQDLLTHSSSWTPSYNVAQSGNFTNAAAYTHPGAHSQPATHSQSLARTPSAGYSAAYTPSAAYSQSTAYHQSPAYQQPAAYTSSPAHVSSGVYTRSGAHTQSMAHTQSSLYPRSAANMQTDPFTQQSQAGAFTRSATEAPPSIASSSYSSGYGNMEHNLPANYMGIQNAYEVYRDDTQEQQQQSQPQR